MAAVATTFGRLLAAARTPLCRCGGDGVAALQTQTLAAARQHQTGRVAALCGSSVASRSISSSGGLRSASGSGDGGSGDAASATPANSYISLGAFETMGGDMGRAATAIAYMQDTLRLQEEQYLQEQDPRKRSRRGLGFAQTLMQVGQQHHQQQDPEEAVAYYQRARGLLEEFLKLHEPNEGEAPSSAALKAIEYGRFVLSEICSSLGVANNDLGRHDEALAAHQDALKLRKETVGKNHPSIAECINNLGAIYFARGSLQKAVEHYEQALERLVEATQGQQEGAYVALTLYNIGVCRARLGNRREADVALRRALDIAKRALGEKHQQVDLIRETIKQQQQPAARGPAPAGGPQNAKGEPEATS